MSRGATGRAAAGAYLAVGLLSVGVDVGLLVLLREVVQAPLALATAVAFGASVLVNFTLNRLTFATATSAAVGVHALRYGSLVAANWAVTVLVVTLAPTVGVPYLVAKLGIVAASTVWNFLLYRSWVFG